MEDFARITWFSGGELSIKGGTIDNFLPIYCNEGGHKNITEPYREGGVWNQIKCIVTQTKLSNPPSPEDK